MLWSRAGSASLMAASLLVFPIQGTSADGHSFEAECGGFAPVEVMCDEEFLIDPAGSVQVIIRGDGPVSNTWISVVGLESGAKETLGCVGQSAAGGSCRWELSGLGFKPLERARLVGDVDRTESGVAAIQVGGWRVCAGALNCGP